VPTAVQTKVAALRSVPTPVHSTVATVRSEPTAAQSPVSTFLRSSVLDMFRTFTVCTKPT